MRTIEPWLREILRCPACLGALRDGTAPPDPAGGPARAELHCTVCRLGYRVENGIPVLLVDEARSLGEGD